MVNYPAPLNNGNSQAYTCVAWRNGKSIDTLIAKAGEGEEMLLATFDMDDIRDFRTTESWRMDYRRARAMASRPQPFGPLRRQTLIL
jgi:predicted amidohydrolase